MLATFDPDRLASAGPTEISDSLEQGRIAYFPECPIELPPEDDLRFLRDEMPRRIRLKNVSYHPEAGRLYGIEGDRQTVARAHRILEAHSARLQAFLGRAIPTLAKGWKVGTSSFRPMQEKGRDLSPHASNERVHVDAGAYGATHGDRVLRFFVNVNPSEDRVWASKGNFAELYRRYGAAAGVAPPDGSKLALPLGEGPLDRALTITVGALARLVPAAKMLDTSPYDRAMRRFHNFMKDTPEFQQSREGHWEFAFKPFTAWMVFTDAVSHACLSGQHAFADTFIVPLANCRLPEWAPYHILHG